MIESIRKKIGSQAQGGGQTKLQGKEVHGGKEGMGEEN